MTQSKVASEIWQHFAGQLQIQSQPSSINELAEVWLLNNSLSNPSGICKNIIFGLCLWEIWKQRNKIIFEKGFANSQCIIDHVKLDLQRHLRAHKVDPTMGEVGSNLCGDAEGVVPASQLRAVRLQQGTAEASHVQQEDGTHQDGTDPAFQYQQGAIQVVDAFQQAAVIETHPQLASAPTAGGLQGAAVSVQHISLRGSHSSGPAIHRNQTWTAPTEGLKLNIDGCTTNSKGTAGGGIIRDSNGSFIAAFTFFMENIVIPIPALESLLYAASWCRAQNWEIKETETISQNLVNIMQARTDPPWALTYKVRKIRAHLPPSSTIKLIPSSANGVAQALASWALSSKEGQIFSHPSELPPSLRSILSRD